MYLKILLETILFFFAGNPSGKYIFVLSLLIASTVDYQQIIVDM